jgi:signal transduction histidine kinase
VLATNSSRARQTRRQYSLRTVLMIFIASITLFPILGVVFFLARSGAFRLEPWIFIWVGLVVVFAVINGAFAANTLLKPLLQLRDELSGLALKPGALEIDVSDEHPSEVRTLREAFAKVFQALRLERDKRGAFMATLVHDLKTPIIAANHALSAVATFDHLTREERIALVNQIKTENEALLALVQKMVDAYRFEREDVDLNLEPQDLRPIVDVIVNRFEGQAKERGLELRVTGEGRALVARKELERALQNLTDNAIRYASSRIRIEIDKSIISISNDGPTLPTSLENLTQPFNSERVSLAGREYTSGTGGLGLFIVSKIAALHGGRLLHISTTVGTTLALELQSSSS